MTFVSYAQNYEDVMLWRALKHIEKGFYIDVGANDPSIDSVTKAFYERGWHGVNIEPLLNHHLDLQRERTHDINLCCAAGAAEGEIEIWECDVRGWASVDTAAIQRHTALGKSGRYHRVPMTTLSTICGRYAHDEIHFLKIDVEGFEEAVLKGMDFKRFRPWIVVVEATRPNSTEEVHSLWEDLLITANYDFVYADGLNRFYLASEHEELAASLRYPPNIFDGFTTIARVEAESRAAQAESEAQQADARAHQTEAVAQKAASLAQHAEALAQQAEAKAQQAEAKAQQAEAKAQQAEALALHAEAKAQHAEVALNAVYKSQSWRLTAPLRVMKRTMKSAFLFPKTAKSKTKEKVKVFLVHAKLYINRRRRLRRAVLALLTPFPVLEKRLKQASKAGSPSQSGQPHVPAKLANLTPQARRIYSYIKSAAEQHRKKRGD